MPAVRSTNRRSASHQALQPRPSQEPDIIILSSDDESPPLPRTPRANRRKAGFRAKSKLKAVSVVDQADIVEISSEDESLASKSSTSTLASLQQQLKKIQAENERLRKAQISSPASAQQALEFKEKILPALDEIVTCEICTLKMWDPATLACGHTFCQTCLQDWFSTTLVQHMTTHPHYAPNPPHLQLIAQYLRAPGLSQNARRHMERQHQAYQEQNPLPLYTCPTCRLVVKSKPVEAFVLKNTVRTVAAMVGETSPRRNVHGTVRQGDGPWDGFFPRTIV